MSITQKEVESVNICLRDLNTICAGLLEEPEKAHDEKQIAKQIGKRIERFLQLDMSDGTDGHLIAEAYASFARAVVTRQDEMAGQFTMGGYQLSMFFDAYAQRETAK